MISAVTPAVQSSEITASHSSFPTPRTTCRMLCVYSRAKNLNAKTRAATETKMIETASKAGPLSALDDVRGRSPQAVPFVPAPKLEGTTLGAEEEVD